MMHYEETVAVICDKNKKPFRELDAQRLDNGRKAKVFIPFDSEYQFLIKNNSDKRILLRMDIDGSNVTGNGLILNAHSSEYIERFVDIAKKFKFVKLSNEGVSDPTNKENGIVKIRITKEKKIDPIVIDHHHWHDDFYGRRWPSFPPYIPTWYMSGNDTIIGSAGLSPKNDSFTYSAPCSDTVYGSVTSEPASYKGGIGGVKSLNCCFSQQMPLESGATIEGDKSDQIITTTTWNGSEDVETVFTFHLFGVNATDEEREKKMKEYLKLKDELGL